MKQITLATLAEATEQEVFDFVANHLLTQNEKAEINFQCRYRGDNGLKCAAGALMTDEEYLPSFDESPVGCGWGALVLKEQVPNTHCEFIRELQMVHDCSLPHNWYHELKSFAKTHELDFTFIREKFPQA